MTTQGRDFVLKIGDGASPETFTTLTGLTNVTIDGTNGTLTVTTFDDDGVKKLQAGRYGQGVTISATVIAPDVANYAGLRTKFFAGTVNNYQVDNPATTGGATYEGPFIITSFSETGETDGAITGSITLESSGLVTVS